MPSDRDAKDYVKQTYNSHRASNTTNRDDFLKIVENLHSQLHSLTYYSILDVEQWASQDQIKKAYYHAARKFHPDRSASLPSEILKNKLNDIFTFLNEAYKILSQPFERAQYDESLALKKPPKLEKTNADIAKERFHEGRTLFDEGLYSEAEEVFGQAIYLDGSVGDYYYYLSLSLAQNNKFSEAGKFLSTALKLEPSNTKYMAELGRIFLELGYNLRAKALFEKTIHIDPYNKRALAGIQKVKKRL